MMMYLSPEHHRKVCRGRGKGLKNGEEEREGSSFEKAFFVMTRKVTEGFAMGSTFYRSCLGGKEAGEGLGNINDRTLNSL